MIFLRSRLQLHPHPVLRLEGHGKIPYGGGLDGVIQPVPPSNTDIAMQTKRTKNMEDVLESA